MTIENTFERIAVALEAIAASKGAAPRPLGEASIAVSQTAPAPTRGRPKKAATESAEKQAELPVSSPAPAAEKPSSKATTTAPTVAADSSGLTKEDLRVALNALQKATSVDDVKRVLASFKAQTLSQVPEDKYKAVIDRAAAMVKAAAGETPADPGDDDAADADADPFA